MFTVKKCNHKNKGKGRKISSKDTLRFVRWLPKQLG
jgi:hypothetical protein